MFKTVHNLNKRVSLLLFFGFLPLFTGCLIYFFFRSGNLVFYSWLENIGISIFDSAGTLQNSEISQLLPSWIIFSLPNGLWAFSYSFLITSIWDHQYSVSKYMWLASIPILIFGVELLQLINLLPGTFSFMDLVFGAGGIILGYHVGKLNSKLK